MDYQQALKIIIALSEGIDPITGEIISNDNVIRHADSVTALNAAIEAIEKQIELKNRRTQLPDNAGKPWSAAEDKQVAQAYDNDKTIAEIAKEHGRTKGAIQSRLVKLGKLVLPTNDENKDDSKYHHDEAGLSEGEDRSVSAVTLPASFKKCQACGEDISLDRIKAIPTTKTCLACQEEIETSHPEMVERKVKEEGLAGSREDHKKMRSNQWRDIQRRNRGD